MKLLLITLPAQGQQCWAVFQVLTAQAKSWEAPTLPWKPSYECMMQPCGGWPQTQELLIWVTPARRASGWRTPGAILWCQQPLCSEQGILTSTKSSITSVLIWNPVGFSDATCATAVWNHPWVYIEYIMPKGTIPLAAEVTTQQATPQREYFKFKLHLMSFKSHLTSA